jgi:ribosomal protein S18 acetylase RimI-like enzyme
LISAEADMNFEIVPAHDVSLADQAKVFTDAFAGYVAGSFQMDAAKLAAFIAVQGIDLGYSRFVRDREGSLVSFGYINRTAGVSRLAGMGTIASSRRSGAAMFTVNQLLNDAKQRSDQAVVLEVIEQNPPAVALYRSCGFREITKLLGWRSNRETIKQSEAAAREISIADGLRLPNPVDYPDLPWQISRYAGAKVATGRAFALDNVAVVIGDPNSSPVRLHGYLGYNGANWATLRSLTSRIVSQFRNTEFVAPPIFPEVFGREIFEPLKFGREPLSQLLMRKDL